MDSTLYCELILLFSQGDIPGPTLRSNFDFIGIMYVSLKLWKSATIFSPMFYLFTISSILNLINFSFFLKLFFQIRCSPLPYHLYTLSIIAETIFWLVFWWKLVYIKVFLLKHFGVYVYLVANRKHIIGFCCEL